MTLLLVLVGALVGAPLRYAVDVAVQSRHSSPFPWGTFVVNVVGSLVLGLVLGAAHASGAPDWLVPLVGTGFCGALTTFSTFGFETVRLYQQRAVATAALNVVLSLAVGFAAALAGWELGIRLATG